MDLATGTNWGCPGGTILHVGFLSRDQFHEAVEERHLFRVEESPGFVERHELGAVHLPRGGVRGGVGRCRAGETVDVFLALAVDDVSEGDEFTRLDAGLFAPLPAAPGPQ